MDFAPRLVVLVLALALVPSLRAEELSPGRYSGIVFFDRWGSCILYQGVYLSPISERVKGPLREHAGKAVTLAVTEIMQPINPGDGLIQRFTYFGPWSTDKPDPADFLKLTTRAGSKDGEGPACVLEMENAGTEAIDLTPIDLGYTLLAKKPEPAAGVLHLEPADGPSFALITRQGIPFRNGEPRWQGEGLHGIRYAWSIERCELPKDALLQPGGKFTLRMSFTLPRGEYQFLCGFRGGAHGYRYAASNPTAFDVDAAGKVKFVRVAETKRAEP